MRAMRLACAGLLLIAAAALVAGCGDSPAPAEPDAGVTLTVRVMPTGGEGSATAYTLACGARASGSLPDPAGACRRILSSRAVLSATPAPGEVCTEIYGGPQVIELSGTYAGAPEAVRFTRANGCEIARYDAAVAVLFGDDPPPGVTATDRRPSGP